MNYQRWIWKYSQHLFVQENSNKFVFSEVQCVIKTAVHTIAAASPVPHYHRLFLLLINVFTCLSSIYAQGLFHFQLLSFLVSLSTECCCRGEQYFDHVHAKKHIYNFKNIT